MNGVGGWAGGTGRPPCRRPPHAAAGTAAALPVAEPHCHPRPALPHRAGTLWLVYGLAIADYFIAVPNGVGALLGCIYLLLICLFPRKHAKRGSPSTSEGDTPSRRELMRGTSGEAEAPADGSANGHALADGGGMAAEAGKAAAAADGAGGLSIPAEAGDLQLARAV